MTQATGRYEFVPGLLKRMFQWGILGSGLFFLIWYLGGVHVWGWAITWLIKLVTFFQLPLSYQVDRGALVFLVRIGQTKPVEIGYFANQWNLAIAEVLLLVILWWKREFPKKRILILYCIALLAVYQVVVALLNLEVQVLGPDLPNQLGILWEHEGSLIYRILRKAQLFETFIARYWVGFPIFGIAFIAWRIHLGRGKSVSSQDKFKV